MQICAVLHRAQNSVVALAMNEDDGNPILGVTVLNEAPSLKNTAGALERKNRTDSQLQALRQEVASAQYMKALHDEEESEVDTSMVSFAIFNPGQTAANAAASSRRPKQANRSAVSEAGNGTEVSLDGRGWGGNTSNSPLTIKLRERNLVRSGGSDVAEEMRALLGMGELRPAKSRDTIRRILSLDHWCGLHGGRTGVDATRPAPALAEPQRRLSIAPPWHRLPLVHSKISRLSEASHIKSKLSTTVGVNTLGPRRARDMAHGFVNPRRWHVVFALLHGVCTQNYRTVHLLHE